MTKPKVLITRPDISPEAIEKIKAKCEVDIYSETKPITKEELLKKIPGKVGILCMLTDCIDKDVIEAAGESLKVIATMSDGFEHIDLKECKNRKIVVSNTPGVETDSVAEFTVTLMLAAGRNLVQGATAIKNGEWKDAWSPVWMCGQGLHDSVVGIVGMGRIGQAIMKRMLPFGVKKVLYFDVFHPIKPAEEMGAVFTEMEELLKNSDFVISMCNLSDETKHLFNKKVFGMMKKTAVFVNTSRGGVVHQADLYDALKNMTIRAAALDVTDPAPLPKDHELLTLPNIIITPHLACSETHVEIGMAHLAAENLLLGIKGEKLVTPVPMPK